MEEWPIKIELTLEDGQEVFLLKTKGNPVDQIRTTLLVRAAGRRATFRMKLIG